MKKRATLSVVIGFVLTASSLLPFPYVQKLLFPGEALFNLLTLPVNEDTGQNYGLAVGIILLGSVLSWSVLVYVLFVLHKHLSV